jgi:hypothetical protein
MAEYMKEQVKAIEHDYQMVHPDMSIDQYALYWIKDHAAQFRADHNYLLQGAN